MKKTVLFIITLFAANLTYAADDSLKIQVRNKWCNNKDSVIVYEGGFNVIQVYGKDIDPKEIGLRSLNSKLKLDRTEAKGDTANTVAMPTEAGESLRLAVINKKTGKVLKELTIYSDKLPEPRARIGYTIVNGIYDKKTVLNESYIRVYHPNSSYCYPFKVLRYSVKAKQGNVPMQTNVIGFEITTPVKQLIKSLPTNGIVEFTDIIAVCPECFERKLNDIKIAVK